MTRICFTLFSVLLLSTLVLTSYAQEQFETFRQIAAGQGYNITPLAGDYDGDGDMDILGTGNYIQGSLSTNATVLLRNDGGVFVVVDVKLPWFYSGGMYQWADIDNDNDLDIIAGGCGSYCYNSKVISIYRNDGADNFTLITAPTNLIGGKLFNLTDYNNDGLIDIEIATQSDNDDSMIGHTFYKNTGNFVFQKTFELPVIYGQLTWGDLDNDGWKDFVLYNHAYKNLHDGTFQVISSPALPQEAMHFFFDADDDGDNDIIDSGGRLMVNDGTGVLTYGSVLIPFSYINSLVSADFDGDGDEDIVASGGTLAGSKTQFFRNNGNGTFTSEDPNEQYTYQYLLAVADMDNDKDPDLLLSGVFTDNIVILENALTTELSKPAPPSNLIASANASTVTFSWNAGTDPEQSSLEYNMYLLYGDYFKIGPSAELITGAGFLSGTANAATALQKQISTSDLPDGYYQWSVQSVDDELNASKFAAPNEFTLYKDNPANAPTSLTTTVVDEHSVSLAWTDNSSDETGFTIERSSMSGNSGFTAVQSLAANVVSATDNTVLQRNTYYYRIRLDGSAAVAYSNVVQIVTKPAVAIAPDNATGFAINSASAEIDWIYSGTSITGFAVERSIDDTNHFMGVGSTTAEKRNYIDQQLESGRTYYYRVSAMNNTDVSDYSNIVKVTIPLKELNRITLPSLMYDSRYIMGAIAWGDYDNDGNDDLFLGYKAQLFHNKGDGTFEPVTQTGITGSATANDFVAVWGDYDNDGFMDIYYYTDSDKGAVYHGSGNGTFKKVATSINDDQSQITNATWTDFDMDGDLDLSITGGRYIYRYDGNNTFVRVDLPANNSSYYSSVASWADYDDDGDPDVFWGNKGKDELFRNNGDGTFTSVTDQRVTKDYNFDCCPISTPTAIWADFNNDKKLDLAVFHSGEPIYVYANHGNTFDSAFYSYEYNREPWKNLFWNDYDNDGDLDLFAMGQYNIKTDIWENKVGQPFRLIKGGPLYDYVSSDANFSWNDFDNDGYSDLFQFDGSHQVYKNLSNGNNWIKIRLRGRTANSTGLGAKVFVKSNNQWQRSDVTTHHSYRVQQGFFSLFGLGKSSRVDSVKIIWPSGSLQYLTNVNVNQFILIDEQNAQVKNTPGPANLLAKVEFPSSITLNWSDRSQGQTGFVIEMATGEGPFAVAGTVGVNTTSFKVNGLSIGVKYKFRVRAASQVSDIKWTNVAEAQIRLFSEVSGGDLTNVQSLPDGAAWGDPDRDGDPDLFVGSQSFEPDAVYYNDNGVFTKKNLRTSSNYSRQGQWVDYDNDGYQDLHVSVGGGIGAIVDYLNDLLYKNNGSGQLVEQTGHILAKDGYPDYTAAWGDLNKDEYLDMIAPRDNKSSLFVNVGGNIIQQQLIGNFRAGEMVLLSDIDSDRDLDLISGGGYGPQSMVFENANGQFTPNSNTGLPSLWYSFILEDFDNDGSQDLLVVGDNQLLRLYLYDLTAKKFKEKANVFPPVGPVSKLSTGDFDNNGFMDVFVIGQINSASNTNRIFLNNGNLKFASLPDPILDRYITGIAVADVNKDGGLDLVAFTNTGFDGKRYLLKGNRTNNHWLRVKLKGVVNKFGIGAKIRLFTGNTSQVRDIRSGSGGTFSDEQIAHFGLGATTTIDYIKVEWPSGETQWISNPSVDTEMIVEQENTPGPASPANPTNLAAAFRAPGYVDLAWKDNSDNERSFRIERAIGTSSYETLTKLPANVTGYTDSSFVNFSGKLEVKYRVVAIVFVGVESGPSNEASVLQVTTGLEDNMKGLVIYPQPASSKLFIRSAHPIQSVVLTGVLGESVTEVNFSGANEVEIPVNDLVTGVYFMHIITDQGTHIRKILVAGN